MIKSVDDILALVNAGFSREEINQMMAVPEEPEQKNEPEPANEPEQKADSEPEKPENKPDTSGEDNITKMLDKLNKTLVDIQNSNIARSQQPEQTETVDDILASVINPKSKKE